MAYLAIVAVWIFGSPAREFLTRFRLRQSESLAPAVFVEGGDKDHRPYVYTVNAQEYSGSGRCRYPHGTVGESTEVWYLETDPRVNWPGAPCSGHPSDGLFANLVDCTVVGILQWLLFGVGGLLVVVSNLAPKIFRDENGSKGP